MLDGAHNYAAKAGAELSDGFRAALLGALKRAAERVGGQPYDTGETCAEVLARARAVEARKHVFGGLKTESTQPEL